MTSPDKIRRAGKVVLVAGLVAAVILYLRAIPDGHQSVLGIDVRTNRDTLQLEKMGGKSYVVMHDLTQWFASLWQGERRAYTIGVLAVGGFLFSRWLAEFLASAPPEEKSDAPVA